MGVLVGVDVLVEVGVCVWVAVLVGVAVESSSVSNSQAFKINANIEPNINLMNERRKTECLFSCLLITVPRC